MRQESGYTRDAVSHADAVGLLQVLPSTGRAVGKRLGVEVRREMLFDPRWNIRLGVAEIAEVLEAFDGNLPLAVAAYNAGEARVRRWLREQGETDLDLFVERIPFNETRGYVRRVMSHYARYRYLEDPEAGWPAGLPPRVGP
jgi:soluble lytic murein transglycosylase